MIREKNNEAGNSLITGSLLVSVLVKIYEEEESPS